MFVDLWNQVDNRLNSEEEQVIIVEVLFVNVSDWEDWYDHAQEVNVDGAWGSKTLRYFALNKQQVFGCLELLHLLQVLLMHSGLSARISLLFYLTVHSFYWKSMLYFRNVVCPVLEDLNWHYLNILC